MSKNIETMNEELYIILQNLKPSKRAIYLLENGYENIPYIIGLYSDYRIAKSNEESLDRRLERKEITKSKKDKSIGIPSIIQDAKNLIESKTNNSVVFPFDTSNEPLPTFSYTQEWYDSNLSQLEDRKTAFEELFINNEEEQQSEPETEIVGLRFIKERLKELELKATEAEHRIIEAEQKAEDAEQKAERESQALAEILIELTKAKEEVKDAKEISFKIITDTQTEADNIINQAKLIQAGIQEEKENIITKAKLEAEQTADRIIKNAKIIEEGIEKERQTILTQSKLYAEQTAQAIIKEAKEAEKSLIRQGGNQGEEVANNIIKQANDYYLKQKVEGDDYYKQKITEANAIKPPVITSEPKSTFYSDTDDIDGIYHIVCEGLYFIDIDTIEGKKVLTIKNDAELQVFRHRIS